MHRGLAWVLVILLMAASFGNATAEGQKAPDFILEGFDGESINRNWETNLFFERMEEKTGISFEFRQYSNYETWATRKKEILAKTNLPDVLFKAELSSSEVRDLYEAGVLADLKPYLEENAPDLWKLLQEDPAAMSAVSMPDGSIPALPAFNSLQNNDVMWINTQWLKKLGMEMPGTAEELKETLIAFRDGDPNGNRKQDEIPLTFIGMWELRFLGHAFGIIDNDYYVTARDGKVTSSLTSENNREFLTWLHELWDEKLLDHIGFSTTDSLRQITDEKKDIPYGVMMANNPLIVVPSTAISQYSVLEPMKYEGKREYRDLTGNLIPGTFAITTKCQEPEKLLRWVNLLYTEEGALMSQYGLEGQEYSWRDDGLWEWNYDLNTVAQEILSQHTIANGASIPCITPMEFQTKYADESTRSSILQLMSLKEASVLPVPTAILTKEDENALAEIQKELAPYAEKTMACFVTGDVQLNDENWTTFCNTVEEMGLGTIISIWQKYIR